MATFLFCAVDGGAYSALLPVAWCAEAHGHKIVWVTQVDSVAASKVTQGFAIEDSSETIEVLLYEIKPDVVVAGVSGNGKDIAFHLPQIAIDRGIKVVKVVDFWNTGMPHERGFASTRLCVLDESSRHTEKSNRNMPASHVVCTGGPQFDALQDVRPLSFAAITKNLGSPFFLLCAPSTKKRVEEIFDLVIPALGLMKGTIGLGVLWHPKSKNETYVAGIEKRLGLLSHVGYVRDDTLRQMASNDVLLASASLVIGSTSTELLKACYLRVPCLSILPTDGANHEVLQSRGMFTLPTSVVKATWHAETAEEVACYMRFLIDRENKKSQDALALQKHAQMKHYTLDGKNAKRVVDVLESLL